MRLMMTMILLTALAMASSLSPARAELVDLELVLAVDISGSVDEEEAELQRAGYVAALMDKNVIRAIQSGRLGRIALTYVEWAGDYFSSTLVDWTVIDGAGAARAFARRLAKIPLNIEMWTSISGAIDHGLELFNFNPYRGKRRVLDISGDGPNNDGGPVPLARDRAVKKGIVINGLPIINGRPSRYGNPPMPHLDNYYRDCVIGGFGSFIVVANTFNDFARAIRRKMILEIAGLMPEQDRPGIIPAKSGVHPPCDTGEIIRDSRESF
jgi:hypothetical protein